MLEDEYGTQTALAEKLGKSPSQINQWMRAAPDSKSGKPRTIGNEIAREIEQSTAKPRGWMDQPTTSSEQYATAKAANVNTLSIPLLANSGSMGPGDDELADDVIVGNLALSADWVQRHVRPSAIGALRFIHGYGDSMAPTFQDGDVLLVDTQQRDPGSIDGVYVLRAHGRLFVKRVRRNLGGQLEVSSDNPTVKTVDILNGGADVSVAGRVIWAWNGRKL